jgi:hypothetical protein
MIKLRAKQYTTICHIFQTVYQILTLIHPITDLLALNDLQAANELEKGCILQHNYTHRHLPLSLVIRKRLFIGNNWEWYKSRFYKRRIYNY